MPRKNEGTIWRPKGRETLLIRITVKDDKGKTHRPWIELDHKLSDDKARTIAKKVAAKAQGQPWDPSQFKKKSTAAGPTTTADEYFDQLWLPSRSHLRSVRVDRYRWRLHISPLIGKKRMAEITTDHLRDVVEALDAKAKNDAVRFGAKTACNCWALVSKMFDDAVESKVRSLRILTVNPAKDVRPPDPPGDVEKQWLFPVELHQLLSCKDVPLVRRRLYAAAVYCYTRPGETLAFLWEQSIDLKHGMVRVNRSYDHIEDEFREHTKTEDSRHFAIEPILRPMFEAMWKKRDLSTGLVFQTETKLAETLRADLLAAGVDRSALHRRKRGALLMRFHDLRATGITYMAIRGDSDHDVRERAGHADFATTTKYIRRGHLAARAVVGDPFAPLPDCLLSESSTESSTGSGSNGQASGTVDEDESGRRDLNSLRGLRGPTDLRVLRGKSGANAGARTTTKNAVDDSETIRRDLIARNQKQRERLERLAAEGELVGPGLAMCRAFDASLRGNLDDVEDALEEAAAAAGFTYGPRSGKAGR